MLLTGEILQKIVPTMKLERANEIAALINDICPKYNITNKDLLEEFLAQLIHESGGFRLKTENLNYSTDALLRVFSKYFKTRDEAQSFARNPEKIGNRVYSNRMGNGDEWSGDGFRYRGGGFIQLTGKDMYKAYANYVKKPLEETAHLVRTDDRYALDSACWFFTIVKGLLDEAMDDEFLLITKRINGGTNGLHDREYYYQRAKQFLQG
jgi:putative chitinase